MVVVVDVPVDVVVVVVVAVSMPVPDKVMIPDSTVSAGTASARTPIERPALAAAEAASVVMLIVVVVLCGPTDVGWNV